jgi:hypothetical protein
MHFGTFQLTTEPIDEPQRALSEALASHRIPEEQFRTVEFGGSFVVQGNG